VLQAAEDGDARRAADLLRAHIKDEIRGILREWDMT